MKSLVLTIAMAFALVLGVSSIALAGDAGKGKALFEGAGKCKTCHKLTADKLVGPGLAEVSKRIPDEAWLKKWILDSQAVWDGKDATVEALKARAGKAGKPKTAMKAGKLTDAEVDDVIAYLKTL